MIAGSWYGCTSTIAFKTSCKCSFFTNVSMRSSSMVYILFLVPVNGFAFSSGRNLPVPFMLKEQESYSPMCPAPALDMASLISLL